MLVGGPKACRLSPQTSPDGSSPVAPPAALPIWGLLPVSQPLPALGGGGWSSDITPGAHEGSDPRMTTGVFPIRDTTPHISLFSGGVGFFFFLFIQTKYAKPRTTPGSKWKLEGLRSGSSKGKVSARLVWASGSYPDTDIPVSVSVGGE